MKRDQHAQPYFITKPFMSDEKLIAYCGLDCAKCDARIATVNNDDELRAKTAELWCKLNQTDAIKPEHINCLGCKCDGPKTVFCSTLCEIRKCAIAKGFKHCGKCPEMETCETVKMIHRNNAEAKINLTKG